MAENTGKFRATENQQRAISKRSKNVLVAAGAGSGKTKVLTERILSQIAEGEPLDSFLVLTFTDAAAAEMKNRITQGFKGNTDNIADIEDAEIKTFHAFCRSILVSYHHFLDIDPSFEVVVPQQADALLRESIREVLDDIDPSLLALYSGMVDLSSLISIIHKIIEYANNDPEPEQKLQDLGILYDESPETEEFLWDLINEYQEPYMMEIHKNRSRYIALMQAASGKFLDVMDKQLVKIKEVMSQLYSFTEVPRAERLLQKDVKGNVDISAIPPSENILDEKEFLDVVKTCRNAVTGILKENFAVINKYMAEHSMLAPSIHKTIQTMAEATGKANKIYQKKLLELNILDYSSLEHLALKLLDNEYVRNDLRSRLTNIYVDEYQDSSPIQEALICKIKGESNLFLVGDLKQSIYGFRNADTRIFAEKIDNLGPNDELIPLKDNFRTRAEILDLVNQVFSKNMKGEIKFDEDSKLDVGAQYPPRDDAFEYIVAGKDDCNAAALGAIKKQMAENVYDLKQGISRPCKYSDIVILFPKRAPGKKLATYLMSQGLPVLMQGGEDYFKKTEILLTISMLKLIVNPLSDVDLAAVLRSPFFQIHMEDIEFIAKRHKYSFYDRCIKFLEEDPEILADHQRSLQERLGSAISIISELRRLSKYTEIPDLLQRIFSVGNFYSKIGTMFRGQDRQKNLGHMIDLAADFTGGGLGEFIDYIDEIKRSDSTDFVDLEDDSVDAIRIMTIHKSKGREYPVVILGDVSTPYSKQDSIGNLLLHRDLGAALKFIDPSIYYKQDNSIASFLIKYQTQKDQTEEELRLLYVAMTRAMDKLIMLSSRGEAEVKTNSHESFLVEADLEPKFFFKEEPADSQMEQPKESSKENSADHSDLEYLNECYSPLEYESNITEVISPSRLQGLALRIPKFKSSEKGMLVGSIYHRALELLDFAAINDANAEEFGEKALSAAFAELGEPGIRISNKAMQKFMQSDLRKRISAAKKIYKEQPFVYFSEGGKTQGIIDLFFTEKITAPYEGDRIVLLDYKSDSYTEKTIDQIAEKYRAQLQFYQQAIEDFYKTKVEEVYIFFLSGDGYLYPLN